MVTQEILYNRLSTLVCYPSGNYSDMLKTNADTLAQEHPEARKALDPFLEWAGKREVEQLEEDFARTFDINPVAALEVGWHLWGENYGRGDFLVKMRGMLRKYNIKESSELPDHLMHVLLILGRLEKKEADTFAMSYVLPAVEKMIEGFKKSDNPFVHVLKTIKTVLNERHAGATGEVSHG